MEIKVNFNVMDCIETIVKFSEDSLLRESFFESVHNELQLLSNYLQTNREETVFFACALAFWFDRNNFSQVFQHLGLKEYQILKYRENIEVLYQKNLLINEDQSGNQINRYGMSQTLLIAVSKNLEMDFSSIVEDIQNVSLADILQEFDAMSDHYDLDKIRQFEFERYITSLQEKHKEVPFFSYVDSLNMSIFELFFLMNVIWDAISNGDNNFNTRVSRTVEGFCKYKSKTLGHVGLILEHQTKLTKLDLIELSSEAFRTRIKAKLSKKMLRFLKDNEGIQLDDFQAENSKLIQCKQIKKKELFYNETEVSSINHLKLALREKHFRDLQKRLEEKSIPLGITILLYGQPGTGKTESVYQLARETNRNIFKVDISETKSMWFGESQKLVKMIFDDYKKFREEEKNCPILLFNEADAVIGKRKPAGSSNVSDAENAIQNILLEELENFEGILFATTNLVGNLDTAFERRFLYKIRFEKPESRIAAKVWRSKLPFLKLKEAEDLALKFPFSGGEIENIARKILISEVLNGVKPDFEMVLSFCKDEKWALATNDRKIGF